MNDVDTFLNRMAVLYGSPDTPDMKSFVSEYRKMLERYDGELLQKAGDIIRDTHQRKSWPTPGEIRIALINAADAREDAKDWDAIEEERKAGWRFSDLKKAKFFDDPEWQKEHETLMANFRAFMSKVEDDEAKRNGTETDWKRGQRDSFDEMQRTSAHKGMNRQ